MNFLWFKIFNRIDFEAEGLVSKEYTLELENIGEKKILVTQGNYLSISYEGVFLSLNMSEENPFKFDSHAIFIDTATDDVYLGLPI